MPNRRGIEGRIEKARKAARAAGARGSLTWRVTRTADSLRIETRLIPLAGHAAAVTRVYAFRASALPSTEQAIAADLTTSLGFTTPSRPPGNVARSSTSNPDAYVLLLRAQYYNAKRNNEAFSRAAGLVRAALDIDPTYADAYAVLSETYQGFAWYGHMPADEAFAIAETAARKAIAFDSTSGYAHAMMAASLSFYHYRWAEGELEFKKAIDLDPDDGQIRNFYAIHLRSLGRFPEALEQIRRAHELDQLYRHYYWAAGYTLTLAGRDDCGRDSCVTSATSPCAPDSAVRCVCSSRLTRSRPCA